MLGAQSTVRMIASVSVTDQTNPRRWIASSHSYSPIHYSSLRPRLPSRTSFKSKHVLVNISCKTNNRGGSNHKSNNRGARDDDNYVEATLLLSETISHYRMLTHGFREETKWQSSAQLLPVSVRAKDPTRLNISSIGLGFLRRFQSPAIFLKVSCGGDYLLPILVGEYAVGKIIESLHEDETGDCPNQFQLVRDLLGRLGYEVKMVRITERVINTYFARIYFHKSGEKGILSVDARPSDAINVARRFMAPIFVNKSIILSDAIRIVHGMSTTGNAKSTYDFSLDSAAEGPDLLSEELYLVRNMNIAAREERYIDAAMWRDKLKRFREKNKSRF